MALSNLEGLQPSAQETDELAGHDIVCISSMDWEQYVVTSKQQIMQRLAGRNRVLYVERPISWFALLRPSRWYKLKNWLQGPRQLGENLHAYSPPPILFNGNELPFLGRFLPTINRFNQAVISFAIKRQMKKMGLTSPLLWTYHYATGGMLGKLGEKATLYHIVDEFSAYPGATANGIKQIEESLIKACDLVVVASPELYKAKRHLNPNAYQVSHGVDNALFNRVFDAMVPEAPELAGTPGTRIGYVGSISEVLDLDLLETIAKTYPHCTLNLVGPVSPRFISRFSSFEVRIGRLKAMPNVRFLGPKNRDELPSYLKAFDVCLIPYLMTEHIRKCFPTKFFEYLATGKPIISVDIPIVSDFRELAYVAADSDQFVRMVGEALSERDPAIAQRRIALATENTWEARISQISGYLSPLLKRPKVVHLFSFVYANAGVSGGEVYLMEVVRRLRGTCEQLVVGNLTQRVRDQLEAEGIPCHHLDLRRRQLIPGFLKLLSLLKNERPEALQTYDIYANFFGSVAARLVGIRRVATTVLCIQSRMDRGPINRSVRWVMKAFIRRLQDHVIVNSMESKADLMAEGIPANQISVVYLGLDPNELGLVPVPLRPPKRIGMLARMSFEKGYDTLVEAAAMVIAQEPDTHFVIRGEGPLKEAIVAMIAERNLLGSFTFLGFVDRLADFYDKISLYVQPSYIEGLSIAVAQAMFFGLPVVASDVGGLPESVIHEQTGLLVPPRSPEALAEAILRLLRDVDLAQRLADSGRKLVQERYTLEGMELSLKTAYRQAGILE